MKGVQCHELFGGIELKNHTFSFHFHMSIVDYMMTMSLNKNIKHVKAFLSYILIVEVYFTILIK